MRDALKGYLALASGVTDLTRQRATAAAKALASQGEATAEQVGALAEDLLAQSKQNREAIVSLVVFEVDRALAKVGLAPADEVVQLTERVHVLEAELRELRELRAAGAVTARRAPAKKAPAKKTPTKKAPAKKTGAKKTGRPADPATRP